MKPRFSIETMTQEQFDQILNMMFAYKKLNPNQDVYFTENGITKVLNILLLLNNFSILQYILLK